MVKAWKETVVIPTYEVGMPEKNPIFLENRVYQGSSGAVYPYPVIESISNEKEDKEWHAIFLENEYIKVMVLPELGGRIQMAYDKIRHRHFIYYNHVIKPALVGLAGPWISGGIEFNWPQHHRPSTYMPVDSTIRKNEDGSVTVIVSEQERMTHQKGMASFTLRPGCARIEITGNLYNPTDLPQTFLWWANPAVAVNSHYRSVFPPDINAVFDHGKRAVSSFPIATGTYYKMDYSSGVDIANYKNIFVPTSYMGVNSRFDFEGGYECGTRAGMLHVASHHVSPGKKQWTWGNGDFGRAWDRNLTDEDGPYIELMAGVFTENQPDFSWLMPQEEKEFTQYFLPYRELGMVKNATKDLLMNIEKEGGKFRLMLFATCRQSLKVVVSALRGDEETTVLEKEITISPEDLYDETFAATGFGMEDLRVRIFRGGKRVMQWEAEGDEIRPIPEAAKAALPPAEVKTNEQLLLTGRHLEQYRHATFSAIGYYEEALRRDPDDAANLNAAGLWYLRRGRFDIAGDYFRRAVRVITRLNPNPYNGEPIYNLAVSLKYRGEHDEAYGRFYKATWNAALADASFLECARISMMHGNIEDSLHETEMSLRHNTRNQRSRSLRAAALHLSGRDKEALALIDETLAIDPFNFSSCFLLWEISGMGQAKEMFAEVMRGEPHNFEELLIELSEAGLWNYVEKVADFADSIGSLSLMGRYYLGHALMRGGNLKKSAEIFKGCAATVPVMVFPNSLYAVMTLQVALTVNPEDATAAHLLGNIFYDKRQYDLAIKYWEKAAKIRPDFATTWRNLALATFNKRHDEEKAMELMEKAFSLDPSDARVLMELDQLRKRLKYDASLRYAELQKYPGLVAGRDDLVLERISLLNTMALQTLADGNVANYDDAIANLEKAKGELDAHIFHPWEGGEGKVPSQYQIARVELAKAAIAGKDFTRATELLMECLEYPHHLGEGKLYGAQENDFHYLLGVSHKLAGNDEAAAGHFKEATLGPTDPAPALYYNDAKPDKIFYAGMAFLALGDYKMARTYFNRLVNFGKQHYHDDVKVDYFAVSLPDLLIWDGDLNLSNRIHCLYMLALGEYGLSRSLPEEERMRHLKASRKYLEELLTLEPAHQSALAFKTFINLENIAK